MITCTSYKTHYEVPIAKRLEFQIRNLNLIFVEIIYLGSTVMYFALRLISTKNT